MNPMGHPERLELTGANAADSPHLPALIAGALIIPFRLPRNMIEVTIFPTIVMLFGAIWVTIGGALSPTAPRPAHPAPSMAVPLAALIVVLLVFQLVLRPGIQFS